MPELDVVPFKPDHMKSHRFMLFLGRRGSGKTTLIRDIFYRLRNRYDLVMALVGSADAEENCRKFIPDSLIYRTLDVQLINSLVELSRMVNEHGKPRNVLLLLDDCLGVPEVGKKEKRLLDNPIFREIAFNGRHNHITFAISLQYCMEMPINIRSQIDYVFAFNEPIRAIRKRLWEYFFGGFDDFDSFSKTLTICTQNHECLVLDQTKNTGNMADTLAYYKADMRIPAYQVGKPSYWYLDGLYKRSAEDRTEAALFKKLINRMGDSQQSLGPEKPSKNNRLIVNKMMA